MVRTTLWVIAVAACGAALGGCGRALPEAQAQTGDQDQIGQFTFLVEIDGANAGAFEGVEVPLIDTEIIEFQQGNDTFLRKRPGMTRYSNIVLKRGYIQNDMLWDWRKSIIDGNYQPKDGAIILADNSGKEIMRYNFFDAWPCKWKGFTLDGKGSDVVVEEIELAIERLERP